MEWVHCNFNRTHAGFFFCEQSEHILRMFVFCYLEALFGGERVFFSGFDVVLIFFFIIDLKDNFVSEFQISQKIIVK